MCSSPKGSTTSRRSARIIEMSREQYEEYARMVRHASTCYEKAQQRKAERNEKIAAKQRVSSDETYNTSNGKKKQLSKLSAIIALLTAPIALP